MGEKKRSAWVDAAKGIGILLIVTAHSIRPDMREAQVLCRLIYDLIAASAIGMFVVLSGVTYRMASGRQKPKRFLLRKVQTLLLPFFGYAMFIYAVFTFAVWFPPTARVFQGTEYGGMGLGRYLWLTVWADSPYAAHLWFIWVLFWITLIVYACDCLCARLGLPQQKVLWCLTAVLWVIGSSNWVASSAVQRVLTHTAYFVYGTEIAGHAEEIGRGSRFAVAAVVLPLGVMVWQILTGWHGMTWYGSALWQVVWLAVRMVFMLGIFYLAVRVQDVKWLTAVGRESFWIYLLHQPFCCGFVGLLLYSKLRLPIPPVCAVCVLLGMLLPLCVVQAVRWIPQHRRA